MILCGHSLRSMACILTGNWVLWLEGVEQGIVTRVDREERGLPSRVHVDTVYLIEARG